MADSTTSEEMQPAIAPSAESSRWGRWRLFGQRASVAVWTIVFILLSIYLAWGWITVSDIRSYCELKGYDFEQVLSGIADQPFPDISMKREGGVTMTSPKDDAVLKRLRMSYSLFWNSGATDAKGGRDRGFFYFQGNLFEFFAVLSENAINTLFAFAVGYLASILIVSAHYLRSKSPRGLFYVWLRPLCGAMAAATFFVLILSGGKLIWSQVSHTNSTAIGVIGIFGAVWCERFDTLMKRAVTPQPKRSRKK